MKEINKSALYLEAKTLAEDLQYCYFMENLFTDMGIDPSDYVEMREELLAPYGPRTPF